MPSETEAGNATSASVAADVSSPVADNSMAMGVEDMQLLNEAIRSLPSRAMKDLMSLGVLMCSNLGEQACTDKHVVDSSLIVDEDMKDSSLSKEPEFEPEICSICLGILQFIYCDDKGMLVKKKSAINLAASIAELIKQEGHQIDSFSLEVSIPPIILENEQIIHLHMERKYRSEQWFQERLSKCISTKDALKFSIADPLEKLLDVKSGPSTCRIRLTYTQTKSSGTTLNSVEGDEGCKRRKTGTDVDVDSVSDKLAGNGNECVNSSKVKGNAFSENSFCRLEDDESSDCVLFRKDKINEPFCLVLICYRMPIYFGGRYLKFSWNVSQTHWIIDDERMGEASIEEIIGGNILPACQGDSYKFHAAGREDIDVRMLGSGRPFLVEIQNARLLLSEALVKEIETKINNLNAKLVAVKNLKMVANQGWTPMHEGEAEKQQILQRTPIRVLHHRSPLEREKIIHWMKVETISESSQYFLLHLCTQAGTYIKEFVHGDLGRTHPRMQSGDPAT